MISTASKTLSYGAAQVSSRVVQRAYRRATEGLAREVIERALASHS